MNDEASIKKSRRTLLAIVVVSLLPITAAYFAYFTGIGVPANTVNEGNLFTTPVHVKNVLAPNDAEAFSEDKRWRLLIPLPATCDETCEQNLFTTRQVHIRLGEKSSRVQRYAINLAGEQGKTYLESIQKEHPFLKHSDVDMDKWQSWLKESGTSLDFSDHYYLLVDQEGFAMMYYTTEQHGNQLLKDLKRALKFSIDYQ